MGDSARAAHRRPSPRNGDAAQGTWDADPPAFAASDRVETHHDAPAPVPTLPTSAAIARTMAAGVLFSAAALSLPTTILLIVAVARATANADRRLTFDGASPVLLAVALAIGLAAALAAPFWPWAARRRRTLVLAAIVTVAWPVSGHPLPAAAVAIVAVGLALVRDQRSPGGRRSTSWPLAGVLAGIALLLAIAGVALAHTRPATPPPGAGHGTAAAEAAHRADSRAGHSAAVRTATHADKRRITARAARTTAHEPATGPTGHAPTDGATDSTPADTASDPATAAPAAIAFVRDYYAALDARRYADAWADLPPALRREFGGFARWKDGYARTVTSTPTDFATRADGDALIVSLRLAAHERNCSGVQNFRVRWTLQRTSGTWRVAGLRGSELASPICD